MLTGVWVASNSDCEPYIQADLITARQVFGVTTQGSPNFNEWVESYSISYSTDGITWTSISTVFSANTDSDTKVTNTLPGDGILAQYIRLHPLESHHAYKSLRWDVIGCESCVARYLICDGTEDPVADVTASSSYLSVYSPRHSCLDRADGRKCCFRSTSTIAIRMSACCNNQQLHSLSIECILIMQHIAKPTSRLCFKTEGSSVVAILNFIPSAIHTGTFCSCNLL